MKEKPAPCNKITAKKKKKKKKRKEKAAWPSVHIRPGLERKGPFSMK
jgi:hypothetical protein